MRLVKAQVTDFQSIRDSTEFEVGDVTCLVGKNEAGKTALLKAIYRLNPINASDAKYDVTDDYPRSRMSDYEAEVANGDRADAIVIQAGFELEEQDRAALTAAYGSDCVGDRPTVLTVAKGYANTMTATCLDLDDQAAIEHLIRNADLPTSVESAMLAADDLEARIDGLDEIEEPSESCENLHSELSEIRQRGFTGHAFAKVLEARVPQFLYFDEYYQLRGQDNIKALRQRTDEGSLQAPDYPLLGLIELAGLNLESLADPQRTEALIARLEAAENQLTQKVLTHWSQNRHVRLRFDVRPGQPGDPDDMTDGMNILGRVYDTKHSVSTPLGSRSRGFVWFFSFLAWYSTVQRENKNLILLLDEPGLSLHAKAQGDLLKYFEAELVPHHQVIYTTHSPFMVDPSRFDRVRIVQDKSIENGSQALSPDQEGTRVTDEVLMGSPDTLFPLQAALGYDIHQTLFIGPNCLIVEGVSDLLYLQIISGLLHSQGRSHLNEAWTITPVGGLSKVSQFVALMGAQTGLNMAALLDFAEESRKAVENLYRRDLMKQSHVLTFADFVEASEADVEDMFPPDFYLQLVNQEFNTSINVEDLPTEGNRILPRLKEWLESNPWSEDATFNHYRPARYMMEHIHALSVPDETLDRFEKAFSTLNQLLP